MLKAEKRMHRAPPDNFAELFINRFPEIYSGTVEFNINPAVHENPELSLKFESVKVTAP
jgi:hypothetical protein